MLVADAVKYPSHSSPSLRCIKGFIWKPISQQLIIIGIDPRSVPELEAVGLSQATNQPRVLVAQSFEPSPQCDVVSEPGSGLFQ